MQPSANKRLAVIIPCYNEEHRLQHNKFLSFAKAHPEIDVWFVNDGSSDNTLQILKNIRNEAAESVYVHHLEQNSGKAEAVRSGVSAIIGTGNYKYVGFLDADLSAPLEEIIHVFQAFTEHSNIRIAAASRVKILGRIIERSTVRHYFSRIFVTFYSTILKLPNYDTQCGLKIFEIGIAESIFKQPFVSRWMFDIELFIRTMILLGEQQYMQQVREIPLNVWKEVHGSKLKAVDFMKAPIEIFKIKNHYKK